MDGDGDGKSDGVVTATDGHPFWLADGAWAMARDLRVGDPLLVADGILVVVVDITGYESVTPVYNSSVDDLHTYYVSAGGFPLLVHNRLPDEVRVLVYHYTSRDSYNKIRSGKPYVLKAGNAKHGKGPFVSPLGPKQLKPGDYKSRLGLTREKSQYVMAFRIERSKLGRIKGGRGDHVWTLPGTTEIPRADVEYLGPVVDCE